jgi:hypothetical protein
VDIKVRDANGALLAEGDTVTLIKGLKLKGLIHRAEARYCDPEHSSHRRCRRDRRSPRQGEGLGAAHGVFEEGVRPSLILRKVIGSCKVAKDGVNI